MRCASTRSAPVTFTPLKSDALLRMLICDLAGEEVTRESMVALRDDLADIAARLDEAEEAAHGLPHREKYLLIVTRFLRRYLELHENSSTRSSANSPRKETTARNNPREPPDATRSPNGCGRSES